MEFELHNSHVCQKRSNQRRPFLGKKKTILIANGEYLSVFKCGFTQVGTTVLQLCLDVLFSSKGYLTSHSYFKKSHSPNIVPMPKQNKPNRKHIIPQYTFLSFFSDFPFLTWWCSIRTSIPGLFEERAET